MTTVTSNSIRRTYISTDNFGANIFSYTTSFNPATLTYDGALTALGLTSDQAPKGRILRENGRKLIPGANAGVETYMVGVYDAVSGVSGYIDPNSVYFTPVNHDKGYTLPDGTDPVNGSKDFAPPVFTRGNIDAVGNVTASNVYTSTLVTSRQFSCSNVTDLGTLTTFGNTKVIDVSLGQVFTLGTNVVGTGNNSIDATNVTNGAHVYLQLNAGSNGSNDSIIFGNNIRENATLTCASNTTYMFNFVGVNGFLCELSRTTILPG